MNSVIYPGSFDPVTHGHVDVVLRLRKIFDRVVVVVADSSRKNYIFSSAERVQLLQEILEKNPGVEVKSSHELTVTMAQKENIFTIARSIRTVSDWDYEYALADANKKLNPKIETIFIMADPRYAAISSSLVREISAFGGDTSAFVPPSVVLALKKKGLK